MPGELGPIKNLIGNIGEIVSMLIPILIGVALIAFFVGLVRYIWGGKKTANQGKQIMIAGIVSIFVMVSVYGIVRLVQSTLGIDSNPNIQAPRIPNR